MNMTDDSEDCVVLHHLCVFDSDDVEITDLGGKYINLTNDRIKGGQQCFLARPCQFRNS